MKRKKRRKCRNCKQLFFPDYRNAKRQRHCQKPECRKAAKAESQQRWLKKPENADYFRGPDHVERVRQWRKKHPGYWRKTSLSQNALQDRCQENKYIKQGLSPDFVQHALQDYCLSQPSVFIGLIAHFAGSALQEDIAQTIGRMQQLGNDILYQPDYAKGGRHEKTSRQPPPHPPDNQTVRLGGSSPSP